MAVIYVGYYDDRHIPRLMAMIRSRHFLLHRSDVFFARFDNNAQVLINSTNNNNNNMELNRDGEGSMLEVDLHFASDQSIEDVNRAFNNPMFDANFMQTTVMKEESGGGGGGNEGMVNEAKL